MPNHVTVYSDASYCQSRHIATAGFCMLVNRTLKKHEITLIESISSGNAEYFAAIQGLQAAFMVNDVSEITLYTDFLAIIEQKAPKDRIRADLMKELEETKEMIQDGGIGLKIIHV